MLQLEQARAVAAALAAIRVETEAVERQAGAAAAVGQGPCRDDRDARLAALHLQTLAFDATPDGERLRRHYDACERALHRTIATFLKLRKAAAIAGCQYHLTEREYAGTAPVDPRPSAPCSPSQEPWQPYAPVHEPSNGLPAAPAIRQFHTTAGDAGPDGVVTPGAVIADGPAGYHDGTTAGRAESLQALPTPPARTKRTTSAIRGKTPTPRSNSSSKPPWPTSASRRPRPSASNWGCSSERSWPRPRRFTAWNFSSKPATISTTGEAPSPFPENPGTPIRD